MDNQQLRTDISGAVLAGGKSARMQRSKAALAYKGKTFLQTVVSELQTVFAKVCVISDDSTCAEGVDVPVFPDICTNCGPLGGLHSALVHSSVPLVFVCSTDIPLIQSADIRKLLAAAQSGRIIIASDGERVHPLFGVYPVSLIAELEAALERSALRLFDFIQSSSIGYDLCRFDALTPSLRNINTPEEYKNLEQ
jgi:molybdopterin-guanine dinucleotide biosynthesis protein A